MKKNGSNNQVRTSYILQLIAVIIVLIGINIISSYIYTRFDLTTEKRYTLSFPTQELLKKVDDIVYFRVFLDGEFPAGFKRLKKETKELLDEFRAYNKNIEYEFINPSISDDPNERNATYQLLMEQGLSPTNLQVKTKGGMDSQVIFPGALVSYRNNELPIELLDAQINVPPEAALNNSIQNLEFRFAEVINNLIKNVKPKVAFIAGHGELDDQETYDITLSLQENYIVDRVTIDGQLNSLIKRILVDSLNNEYRISPAYSAIIIAKPDSVFSAKDKFIIDQFIMYGGKVLWLIDPVIASMDSIQLQEQTVAVENSIDLQSQLFTYGVKLNNDLILDLNAMPIPIRTGQVGGQAQIDFFPWYFFPLITPTADHPIVKNLNTIKTQFVSSMDTTAAKGIKKTILLRTSDYSRSDPVPGIISLQLLTEEPEPMKYPGPSMPVAILLEGEFRSDFRNRLPQSIISSKEIGFKEISVPTSMIIVSDGDIIKNQFHIPQGYPLPLGFDQFTGETFGNKEFVLNALNYLTDGPGLISLRSREMKLRLLDKTKINSNRTLWELVNLILPVIIVVFAGLLLIWARKRKYSS
ncbi:MAG: gliding motility-associated ABC transporter substrate-binding protein GldG [Lentimicrobiaceae bacterium]|jgi:ABC-2 type transport system permease protein|nr:gliding motility-associated ABC transporter substrate-binding protein GldG [Lentimicrobiaceae bacterium]MCP4909807.1 gliding motility-associated ABC transporter substrate-binding protein GldG [Bacteroidota bacterium]MBT3454104.1 gliding motility-associated ABC transporter substrate-binding protein GldG [Lentimicrobiaceae bacterium]MBT3819362.1 gliding motility-associated ABC transporter substrate-binding protein GldG [Lentimicrobiaceae bacterium]MBT4060493.1 gliding motility-associated ABC t